MTTLESTFTSHNGIEIAYFTEGCGEPVILVHGFAANAKLNWVGPQVVSDLTAHGRQVIAPDTRGHGASDKPTDPEAYSYDNLAADVMGLADHLGLDTYDLVGYSMGAMTSLRIGAIDPRVRRVIYGGIGGNVLIPNALNRDLLADSLKPDATEDDMTPLGKLFRAFAEASGADLNALAACQRARKVTPNPADIKAEALVLVGNDDWLAGPAEPLAEAIPGAIHKTVPGDHTTCLFQPEFREAVNEFLTNSTGA